MQKRKISVKDKIEVEKPLFRLYNAFSKKYFPKIPFTYYWYLIRLVGDEGETLIDFGCGWGDPLEVLQNSKKRYTVGVDIYKKYIDYVKKKGIYSKVICQDITKYKSKKKHDIVFCSHVLEHIDKDEAKKMVDYFESITKEKTVLAMPVGELPQDSYDNNIYQKHVSVWQPGELRSRGYKVYGFSPKFLYGNQNIIKKIGVFGFLLFLISYILEPVYILFPEKCVYMLAVKEK